MIINHRHRFCFFAIPRTASKSVSAILESAFNSESILKMHTSYAEFYEQAGPEERSYFSFTTIRNPMDSVLSAYFKKKNDHNGRFSRGTFGNGRPIGQRAMEEYRFITKNKASFAEYFTAFYETDYRVPRHEATVASVTSVMRYEQLSQDFTAVLKTLHLPSVTIPKSNQTQGKTGDFLTYYTPEIIPRAKSVFSRIMDSWGYRFPEEWDSY